MPPGNVALVSQSGNVSAQLFLAASKAGFGFSYCVGVGNQLDVGFGDLLSELAEDAGTGAVALYVEGLPPHGGTAFTEGLERCRTAGKPVVVIKAGTSRLAAAVAQTHTRSMAADDRVWDAVLDRSGAVRVPSVPEMADVLQCAVTLAPSGSPRRSDHRRRRRLGARSRRPRGGAAPRAGSLHRRAGRPAGGPDPPGRTTGARPQPVDP